MKRIVIAAILISANAAGQKPATPKKAAPKPAAKTAAPKPVSAAKPGATAVPSALEVPKLPEVKVNLVNSAQPARQAPADTTLGLKPPAVREFAPLTTQQFTLSNGMHVVLHEDRRLPWIAGNLRLAAGSILDPPLKAGLAEITLRTIRSGGGAKTGRTAQQEQLESSGIVFQVDAGERASSLVFRTLSQSAMQALELVRSSVTDPSFDDDALEESRAQMRNRVAARNNSIELIANREVQEPLLGAGSPPRIEYSTLANAGPEDVRQFYRQHITPAAATLILTGDFSAADMRPRIETMFGSWKTPAAPAPARPVTATAPAGVRFAEASRAQAAGFVLARLGPAMGTVDSAAATVLAELLGAGPDSRLAKVAQAKPSWALRATVGFEAVVERPGIFAIRGLCDTPYPVDAMLAIVEAAAAVRQGDFSESAVDAARRAALSWWIGQFPNPLARLSFDEAARRAGLPGDFVASHYKALSAIRKADVVRVAQTLLDPKTFHASVAANATLMNRPVSEFREPVIKVDLTIPVAQPLEAPADSASVERAKAWLTRMQTALGGAEKLAAVKDLEIVSKGTHDNVALQITDRWLAPGTYRQDQETQAGVTSVFYNGEIGWVGGTGRIAALTPGMLLQVRGELLRLLPLLATSDRDSKRKLSHAGSNVLVVTGENGTAVRVYIDEETSLPVRFVYQSLNPAGLPAMAEETWSGWTETAGIRFPGKIVLRMDGRRMGEVNVTSVKVNSGLKPADIERKP